MNKVDWGEMIAETLVELRENKLDSNGIVVAVGASCWIARLLERSGAIKKLGRVTSVSRQYPYKPGYYIYQLGSRTLWAVDEKRCGEISASLKAANLIGPKPPTAKVFKTALKLTEPYSPNFLSGE